jgi:hypothetical protein
MLQPVMPWRLLVGSSVIGVIGGAVFGFVRGLHYLPTLPVAIVEGGFLFGIPATVLGLILVGLWSLGSALRHQAVAQETSAVRLVCLAGEISGGVLAIVAAVALPWAKYRLNGMPSSGSVDAGRLNVALIAVGTAGSVLATAQLRWRAMALAAAQVIVGAMSFVLSVVMVAGRIAHANSLVGSSGGSTAFGAGSGLAFLAALLLLSAALVSFVRDARPVRGSGNRRRSG